MVDSSFYTKKCTFTLKQISEKIGCELVGDKDKIITDVASLDEATNEQITLCYLCYASLGV